MNILLISLTRFGDLLQSQAAIQALTCPAENTDKRAGQGEHKPAPEHKLALVCLENFAFTSVFLRGVCRTFPLPRGGFLSGLAKVPEAKPSGPAIHATWIYSLAELWQWRKDLWSAFKPDRVCNLTPTVPARLLSRYLSDGAELTGFGLDDFGFGQEGPWAAFLRASSRSRFASPFNVIDLFRAVAGKSAGQAQDTMLAPRPQSAVLAMRDRLLAELKKFPEKKFARQYKGFVGLQLGASANERRWPLEYFVQLGQALWRQLQVIPVLLGSKDETPLAERYAEINNSTGATPVSPFISPVISPFISMSGKTNMEDLADVLKNCRLLVSNDTGTIHLAAGLSCPCLGVYLATAQPWDTGPGMEGSCALEPELDCHPCAFGSKCPHDLRCRTAIKAELVFTLVENFLNTGKWASIQEGARVWLTGRDADNCFYLVSLSGHNQTTRTLWFRQQRFFLRQFLDRDPAVDFVLDTAKGNCSEDFVLPPAEREKFAADLISLVAQLELLGELGKLLSLKPTPPLQKRFLSAVQRVSLICENSPYFLALGFLWQAQVQEQGSELKQVLRCITQYHNLIGGLKRLFTERSPA